MVLQRRVQSVLDELVGSGAETGLQVAVHHRGQPVVEAVAGVADSRTGRPVAPDTLFFSFSTGKGASALIAHLLVARGLIGYGTRVADVWPGFGVRGKEATTLRHVLTHTAGVPAMPDGLGPADLGDPERVATAIAAAEPRWPPGARTGYHSYTFGFLVGEIARRLTGHSMGRLLHEWVAAPLGLPGELRFGVPPADLDRLAHLEDAAPPDQSAPWELRPTAGLGNDPALLTADVPSVGTFTARGLATMYAAILDGRLISADQLARLSEVAFEGTDQVFGNRVRLGLGYPLPVLGWPGGGGSRAFAHPATGTSFALTKNRLVPDFGTAERLVQVVTEGLRGRVS
ncbi:serine hydrolase domain-containing protein [Nocardioides sp. QY071]|uniref:serine hydrolase domain-containing protein n=1 Tax=Nocardioides sp. QY071 TaxID=3044187 RepID=UPI00249BE2A7|nr:serine hydrolase domain-containing protein [Nocardioides sp. QY071]WGY00817.1 serine hydrolase domain-containing protein [Nocardioides sp. QY071]